MYTEIFPQRLKDARKTAGYSQEEISEELKINRSSLSKYETGAQEPGLETLAKMAQFYNVSIDWLLGVSIVPPIRPELRRNQATSQTRDII